MIIMLQYILIILFFFFSAILATYGKCWIGSLTHYTLRDLCILIILLVTVINISICELNGQYIKIKEDSNTFTMWKFFDQDKLLSSYLYTEEPCDIFIYHLLLEGSRMMEVIAGEVKGPRKKQIYDGRNHSTFLC